MEKISLKRRVYMCILVSTLISFTNAVSNFQGCLLCFNQRFYDQSYFCNTGTGSCKPATDLRCNIGDIITSYKQCVNGFDVCTNKTFTAKDFQASYSFNKTLLPGWGCFLNVDRVLNGTWGLLQINASNIAS